MAGPKDSSLIDTPGVMNFGLIDVAPQDLLSHFPELKSAAARCPADCAHESKASCALRPLPRHASYRAILASLA